MPEKLSLEVQKIISDYVNGFFKPSQTLSEFCKCDNCNKALYELNEFAKKIDDYLDEQHQFDFVAR